MDTILLMSIAALLTSVTTAPLPNTAGEENGFWFGTQVLECLKGKILSKRSVAPERPTLDYIHRMIYYKGYVFEWGNGMRGYHYGEGPAVQECPVTWEPFPAGVSTCPRQVLEHFTSEYRSHYGGYNLVLNNCHHFANRASIILMSADCDIAEDRWSEFSDKMWAIIGRFVAVFKKGTMDRPQDIQRAASRDPDVHSDWPIVQWYK